jgi:hypothetical protein
MIWDSKLVQDTAVTPPQLLVDASAAHNVALKLEQRPRLTQANLGVHGLVEKRIKFSSAALQQLVCNHLHGAFVRVVYDTFVI